MGKNREKKGWRLKVGLGRVRMKGVWRTWVETEKDEEERVNRKERKKYRSERKVEQRRGKIEFCVNQEGDMTEKGGMKGEV